MAEKVKDEAEVWIVQHASGNLWRVVRNGEWEWTEHRGRATRHATRHDARCAEMPLDPEGDWSVVHYKPDERAATDDDAVRPGYDPMKHGMHPNTEVDRIAILLFEAFAKAEPRHGITLYPTSYWATFAGMARAIIADRASAKLEGEAVTDDESFGRAYFERGFLAAYAWSVTRRESEKLSDAVLDHAWDHRDEGMDEEDRLPVAASPKPTTQGRE